MSLTYRTAGWILLRVRRVPRSKCVAVSALELQLALCLADVVPNLCWLVLVAQVSVRMINLWHR